MDVSTEAARTRIFGLQKETTERWERSKTRNAKTRMHEQIERMRGIKNKFKMRAHGWNYGEGFFSFTYSTNAKPRKIV